MEGDQLAGEQRLLDGDAGDLVPEGPARARRGQGHRAGRTRRPLRSVAATPPPGARHRPVGPGPRPQPAPLARHPTAGRCAPPPRRGLPPAGAEPTGRQDLGDVERVAAGRAMQLDRVDPGARRLDQPAHRVDRQRLESHPLDAGRRGQLTQDDGHRLPATGLLRPVRRDDEHREPSIRRPSMRSVSRLASSAQWMSSRTTSVGAGAERLSPAGVDLLPGRRLGNADLGQLGDRFQPRTQRGRSREAVGRTSPHPDPAGARRQQLREQRALAHPGLAPDEDQPSVARDGVVQQPLEPRQLGLPFEQHGHI